MKVLSIIMLLSAIAILWMVAHVMYKPAYDKLKKEYVSDEDSIEEVLMRTDHAVQYGEDLEPKEPRDEDFGEPNINESDFPEGFFS